MAERYAEFRSVNRRTFPRYQYRAGITVKPTNDIQSPLWDTGISQNLSLDGISILHSKILVPGELVYLTIPLFDTERELVLSGSVEWVSVDDLYEDSPYWIKAGIMFSEMGNEKKKILLNTIGDRPIETEHHTKSANKIDFVM